MSSNRLTYDDCSYKQALYQSISPINYTLDPIKYEHNAKCRHELGIVGGTSVSHIKGNLVDLENDLRGQRRPITKCPQYKYTPQKNNIIKSQEYIKPVNHPDINTELQHLQSCQMFNYPSIPKEPEVKINRCSR
jgi:hypothetical protein